MLNVENLVKKYNQTLVLDIPFLHLDAGLYWVKGENGSGKTTFLKIIAGLIPFEGNVFVNNTSIKKKPQEYRIDVSWAEAEPLYLNFLTGKELLLFYNKIRKSPKSEMDQLIDIFNIGSFINNKVETYSTGMLKKLSLVLAFTGKPALILLDEPFITLDVAACNTLCQYIRERNEIRGTSFLLSSHQELNPTLLAFTKELLIQNHKIQA